MTKGYTTLWTLRAFDAIPGNTLWIGIGFTIGLLLVFFVGRSLLDGAKSSTPDDLRVAITQILITAYSATAYAYLLMSARKTTLELSPVAFQVSQWQTIADRVGKHRWWVLLLVGAGSYSEERILVLGMWRSLFHVWSNGHRQWTNGGIFSRITLLNIEYGDPIERLFLAKKWAK